MRENVILCLLSITLGAVGGTVSAAQDWSVGASYAGGFVMVVVLVVAMTFLKGRREIAEWRQKRRVASSKLGLAPKP